MSLCLDSTVISTAMFIGKSQIWCGISCQIEALSWLYQGNWLVIRFDHSFLSGETKTIGEVEDSSYEVRIRWRRDREDNQGRWSIVSAFTSCWRSDVVHHLFVLSFDEMNGSSYWETSFIRSHLVILFSIDLIQINLIFLFFLFIRWQ